MSFSRDKQDQNSYTYAMSIRVAIFEDHWMCRE